MNIVLTGFMGTGKTAVGRRLAEDLGVPFHDVDLALVKRAGRSIPDIFAAEGEAAFRHLESQMIDELSAQDRTVIATGGGALLRAENRDRLRRNGLLVCLTARIGTLLERLKDDLSRPLLAGQDREAAIERLMSERQAVYAQCDIHVSTDGKTIADVAAEILRQVGDRWPRA